jgi:hypothetical protein
MSASFHFQIGLAHIIFVHEGKNAAVHKLSQDCLKVSLVKNQWWREDNRFIELIVIKIDLFVRQIIIEVDLFIKQIVIKIDENWAIHLRFEVEVNFEVCFVVSIEDEAIKRNTLGACIYRPCYAQEAGWNSPLFALAN